MNAEIFIPMYYMVLLTGTVFLLSTLIRFKNVLVDKSHTGSELMKIPLPESAAQITKQADRNLINLFELPILFYVICVVLYVSGKVDDYKLTLETILNSDPSGVSWFLQNLQSTIGLNLFNAQKQEELPEKS